MTFPLICPVCRNPLTWGNVAAACPSGHSFDIAREGYINLYKTSRRSKNQPGDSRDMLQARRRFLDSGVYEGLSDHINAQVSAYIRDAYTKVTNILDAGCGEGYYLGRLMACLSNRGLNARGAGIDISKEAIRMASRRYTDTTWCVANAAHDIPCLDGAVHLAVSVFAPRFGEVLHRILAPAGRLLVILPGPSHLSELNAIAMAHTRDTTAKEQDVIRRLDNFYSLENREEEKRTVSLDRDMVWDLYRMTPVYWRSTREAQDRIRALEGLEVTTHFVVLSFTPDPPIGHHV